MYRCRIKSHYVNPTGLKRGSGGRNEPGRAAEISSGGGGDQPDHAENEHTPAAEVSLDVSISADKAWVRG